MHRENVKAVCEKHFRDASVPPEVRRGEIAYVFLYGKGHEFFERYLSTRKEHFLTDARECLEAAATNFNEVGNPALVELYHTILMELGAVYSCQGQEESAIQVLLQCLRLSKEKNYTKGIAGALNNLGMVYEQQGDYLKARDSYQESLDVQGKTKRKANDGDYAKTEWNLGRIEHRLNNHEKALKLVGAANKTLKKAGLDQYYRQSSRDLESINHALGRRGSPKSSPSLMSRLLGRH